MLRCWSSRTCSACSRALGDAGDKRLAIGMANFTVDLGTHASQTTLQRRSRKDARKIKVQPRIGQPWSKTLEPLPTPRPNVLPHTTRTASCILLQAVWRQGCTSRLIVSGAPSNSSSKRHSPFHRLKYPFPGTALRTEQDGSQSTCAVRMRTVFVFRSGGHPGVKVTPNHAPTMGRRERQCGRQHLMAGRALGASWKWQSPLTAPPVGASDGALGW